MTDKERLLKRLKTAIIILLAVFIVSFIALAARIVYVSFYVKREVTVVVPDNIVETHEQSNKNESNSEAFFGCTANEKVSDPLSDMLCERSSESKVVLSSAGSVEATVIELYLGHLVGNDAFNVQNMFPGDTVRKYYCLKVYHVTDVPIYFNITEVLETNSLGDVLNINVAEFTGDGTEKEVVCNGSITDVKNNTYSTVLPMNPDKETIVYYRIEVSLPTSAGNEYQGASLSADFNWYAENPAPIPSHVCESKCPICGRCLDKDCTEEVCADKCQGHSGSGIHICESKCDVCEKCKNKECKYEVCSEKCDCSALISKPIDKYIIWPWMILPALSLSSALTLTVIFFKKLREVDDDK